MVLIVDHAIESAVKIWVYFSLAANTPKLDASARAQKDSKISTATFWAGILIVIPIYSHNLAAYG
tara:strand:+ start:223 stop:417 length:195 start_codon:yes stop_codon:yes gene_type:complete